MSESSEGERETQREEGKALEADSVSCRTLIKTQDYLDVFARFKNTENITAVERVLGAHPQLEPFEKSQLGTYEPLSWHLCKGLDWEKTESG